MSLVYFGCPDSPDFKLYPAHSMDWTPDLSYLLINLFTFSAI